MVTDDVLLLRMVWHPSHFKIEQLTGRAELSGAAFDSADLLGKPDKEGNPRYVSVDDKQLVTQESVDANITNQQSHGKDVRLDRHMPRFVSVYAGRVRQCPVEQDGQFFDFTREPIEPSDNYPANPAHCALRACHILEYQQMEKPARTLAVQKMRAELLQAVDAIMTYEEALT